MSARERNRRWTAAAYLIAVAAPLITRAPARADGAFPNSESVLLPKDRPKEIILGTTFGLVFSADDGVTWNYACEAPETPMGRQYLVGPPPDNRIYALSDLGVPVSADGSCTWTIGGGDLTQTTAVDVFPDPSDPMRVFVLAKVDPDAASEEGPLSAFLSSDGGLSYRGPIFTAGPSGIVTGIESSASSPNIVYITWYDWEGIRPRLDKSEDGGKTWTTIDIEPGLGSVVPLLAAVDPDDPRKVYLRITSKAGATGSFEALAVTADGGQTWAIPLSVPGGSLAGFARLPNGNLVAIGTTARLNSTDTPPPAIFRSLDSGLTFTTEAATFHPVGLAQRDGILFAAALDAQDGFALASSSDGGRTWRPRLRFQDIDGIKPCVFASCQGECDTKLAGFGLFPPEVCSSPKPPSPPRAKGCGCVLGTTTGVASAAMAGVALAWAWLFRRGRRPRR